MIGRKLPAPKTDNCEPAVRISNGGYSHSIVTQTVKEYLACS